VWLWGKIVAPKGNYCEEQRKNNGEPLYGLRGPWLPQFFLYLYNLVYNFKYIFSKFNIFNIFNIFDILINFFTFIFINEQKSFFCPHLFFNFTF